MATPDRTPDMYRHLNDRAIADTLTRLRDRIGERFPDSGLRRLSAELLAVAAEVSLTVDYLRRPNWPIRVLTGGAIVILAGVFAGAVAVATRASPNVGGIAELLQATEAGLNEIVFFGIAVIFLITLESRIKRRRALRALHLLRSLAHVIDMHQLTKDPERLTSAVLDTASSPERRMTAAELGRYLDYCSELLSMISKCAALLVQYFDDRVVLAGVNEIEDLTGSLSAKIWQKITILERTTGRGPRDIIGTLR